MKIEFTETWREMVKLYRSGKARAIGVCNFTVVQLEELIADQGPQGVVPAVNQCEFHPYLAQPASCWTTAAGAGSR